jgi:hypothetical protein
VQRFTARCFTYARNSRAEQHSHTVRPQGLLDDRGRVAVLAPEQTLRRLDDVDRCAEACERLGDFAADRPASDDGEPRG